MKNTVKILMLTIVLMASFAAAVMAQGKVDEARMERDVEVAKNVLSTMLRQPVAKPNFVFPMEVDAAYMPGFGVTFRLPTEFASRLIMMSSQDSGPATVYGYGNSSWSSDNVNTNAITINGLATVSDDEDCQDCPNTVTGRRAPARTGVKRVNNLAHKKTSDSLKNAYYVSVIQSSKDFIADYGDMISQLGPDERIVITNKTEGGRNGWLYRMDASSKNQYFTVEANKSDLTQYKQGKLSREQFFAKVTVLNTETTDELSPDLELLGSIFNRLYRADLSKTYFLQEDVYYERLKDYGVIYNMHAYSSNVIAEDYLANGKVRTLYQMPTLQLSNIDRDERLKRVKELYPSFEKTIIDDVLEYSKTLKSLKDNEVVIFNVKLTECKGCNIPTSLEISFKENVLKDYSSGKLTKEAALAKGTIKKGPNQ